MSKLHYTGKERDLESGLDYFGARYFSSTMGRFLSPDWSKNPQGVPYANYANPQSLNLYAFVGNNPTTQADANGHVSECMTCDSPWQQIEADEETVYGSSIGDARMVAESSSDFSKYFGDGSDISGMAPQQDAGVEVAQNNPSIDINKAVNYMDAHAGKKSQGLSGVACRLGLAAGGINTKGHPDEAKDYGSFLEKNGAAIVPQKGYKPLKGDVAVFEGNLTHKHGHVEMYDGKQWVSDFKQKHFSPYTKDTPPNTIYRF